MFNLRTRVIELDGRTDPLLDFQVWWVVPTFGLFTKLEEAVARCEANDMDPQSCCVPTCVAVGQNGLYEVLR